MILFVVGFLGGVVAGAGLAVLAAYLYRRIAEERMRETFSHLAGETLRTSARRLSEQAAAELDSRKDLIDQAVKTVHQRLENVRDFVQRTETQRTEDFGRLGESLASLSATTGKLHEALAGTQPRGAWGRRMADDVLRLLGMQENVNYTRRDEQAEGDQPDFTFFLPGDLRAHMDVQFPLNTFREYLDSDSDEQRAERARRVAGAVREHVEAVVARGDAGGGDEPAVPYAIVFLPSEQIYSLALSADPDLVDAALSRKVVLTSPLTLYAMLSAIRQAAEQTRIIKTAQEVIGLFGEFSAQWEQYNAEVDKLGEWLEATSRQYESVRSARRTMLTPPMARIDQLRLTYKQRAEGGGEEPGQLPADET